MGPQRVLQAAVVVAIEAAVAAALVARPAAAAPAPIPSIASSDRERIAVIDLGGSGRSVADVPRQLVAAGFAPVVGDGVGLDIDADVAGAAIWIDFRPVGASPVHAVLPAGEHVIAAAAGSRRGWAAGTAVASQKSLRVPLAEAAGPWADVAQRVASWN